jgi:hypothetical protein
MEWQLMDEQAHVNVVIQLRGVTLTDEQQQRICQVTETSCQAVKEVIRNGINHGPDTT